MAKKTIKKVLPQAPEGINLLYVILGIAVLLTLIYMLAKSIKPLVNPENQNKTPVVVVDGQVYFETISKSHNSGFGERVFYTINNEEDWSKLWNSMHAVINPVPVVPKVDFDKEMLILAFQGTKNTGGYTIEITGIEKKDSVIGVMVKDTAPGAGCITTQALTSPYHIVKTPKLTEKIEYDIKYEKKDCQ